MQAVMAVQYAGNPNILRDGGVRQTRGGLTIDAIFHGFVNNCFLGVFLNKYVLHLIRKLLKLEKM